MVYNFVELWEQGQDQLGEEKLWLKRAIYYNS